YLFIKFLERIQNDASELFIIGDLFDYWFEYRSVMQKGFFRTFCALKELIDLNIKVHYLIGNHDFLHRDFFTQDIGVSLYKDPITLKLDGKKFFIGHGDGLIKNDIMYNVVKRILRNKFLQQLFLLIHPDLGIKIARSTSRRSRVYTSKKNYGETDGLFETAKEKINSGFDYVLLGHSHVKKFEKFNNGFYINLGSWLDSPCYGLFNDNKFEIINWNLDA
ncbi:UDP-2,3-diacylglucosamine diphosphatase, partial [Bacteroidota bacterium]